MCTSGLSVVHTHIDSHRPSEKLDCTSTCRAAQGICPSSRPMQHHEGVGILARSGTRWHGKLRCLLELSYWVNSCYGCLRKLCSCATLS